MNAYETLAKNVLRKRQSFTLEQRSQITLPNSVTSGNGVDRQIVATEIFHNVILDGTQPSRADAATFGDFQRIPRRTNRHGNKIVDLVDNEPTQLRLCQRLVFLHNAEIADQQCQLRAIVRDPAHDGVVDAGHERHDRATRNVDADVLARRAPDGSSDLTKGPERGLPLIQGELLAPLRKE